ncbi:MAG: anti-sigma factor [Sulfuricaulis sp.]|uniref:anti-sigma factor n=1 Tax=Sulfuricaulis sp. TaxID=2003553 RepID=UPI003C4687E4
MNYDRPELLDRLAAEYVFGTMSARVRRRFQKIQRALPAAQQAVHVWEQRMTPLARSVPPEQPSAAAWEAIDRRTGGQTSRPVAPPSAWLAWLKPALGVAFGVVVTLGLVRLYPTSVVPVDQIVQQRGTLPASYVGLLTDAANNPVVLASSTRYGRIMSIKILRKVDVPPGKVLQLWALPKEGAAFPLGVVPPEGQSSFPMADTSEKLLSSVPRLAVSVEDAPARAGVTPAPYLLTGNCVKLW